MFDLFDYEEIALSVWETFNELFGGMNELFTLAQVTPMEWMDGEIWNIVVAFNDSVVLPIAWSILSLFLLMELATFFKRSDVKGLDGLYWISMIFLKIAVAKMVMENMHVIIGGIFEVASAIVNSGQSFINTGNGVLSFGNISLNEIEAILSDYSKWQLFETSIFCWLLRIAQFVCSTLCSVVILLRFVEVYAFSSLCALPFSTLPSQEYSQIGKSYIKRMVALALHVVFIIVILFIYVKIMNNQLFVLENGDVLAPMWDVIKYSVLLVIALFQSGSWAKQLTGA